MSVMRSHPVQAPRPAMNARSSKLAARPKIPGSGGTARMIAAAEVLA